MRGRGLLVLGGGGTVPMAVGGSWDCYAGLESRCRGAAAATASDGCSGEACLETTVTVGARHPLPQLHLAAVAPVLVHLAPAEVEVLPVPVHHLARLSDFAAVAAASASDAAAFAVALQRPVTWSWGRLAAGLAVPAYPVVLLVAAGDPPRLLR